MDKAFTAFEMTASKRTRDTISSIQYKPTEDAEEASDLGENRGVEVPLTEEGIAELERLEMPIAEDLHGREAVEIGKLAKIFLSGLQPGQTSRRKSPQFPRHIPTKRRLSHHQLPGIGEYQTGHVRLTGIGYPESRGPAWPSACKCQQRVIILLIDASLVLLSTLLSCVLSHDLQSMVSCCALSLLSTLLVFCLSLISTAIVLCPVMDHILEPRGPWVLHI